MNILAPTPAIKQVLIVDDDVHVAQLMARIARAANFETHVTYDSSDIENKLATITPHVLVLDLQMPDVDGVQLLNRIAELGVRVPAVLAGGMGTRTLDTTAQVCRRLGLPLLGGLAKPFDVDTFQRMLQRRPAPNPAPKRLVHGLMLTVLNRPLNRGLFNLGINHN